MFSISSYIYDVLYLLCIHGIVNKYTYIDGEIFDEGMRTRALSATVKSFFISTISPQCHRF